MEQDKVVQLKRVDSYKNKEIIELCESILEDAKAGEILAFVFVSVKSGLAGHRETACVSSEHIQAMIGSMEIAKIGLIDSLEVIPG